MSDKGKTWVEIGTIDADGVERIAHVEVSTWDCNADDIVEMVRQAMAGKGYHHESIQRAFRDE